MAAFYFTLHFTNKREKLVTFSKKKGKITQMKTNTVTPTYRAGANLYDPAKSGFARVEVLGSEDLFPNEGFEFKPGKTKLTNSYRVSEDSPFVSTIHHSINATTEEQKVMEKQMPQMIRTERLCTKAAATAIATGTEGELRPLHSQIAAEAVLKERQQQVYMKEQTRIARMKDEQLWAEIEQQEADATRAFYNRNDTSKRESQQQLAAIYQQEFALHKKRQEEQMRIEKEEADRIAKVQAAEEAAEKEKARKKKEEEKARLIEFEKLNSTMLGKKKKLQEEEREIEKRVQKEHEQQEQQQLANERRLAKIREEKNRRREKIIEIQTKRLEEMNKKVDTTLENAVSEIAAREEKQRLAEIEKREAMRKQRHDEWQQSLKLKEERLLAAKNKPKTPIQDDPDEEARQFEALTRSQNMKRLREAQKKQIEERKMREQKELEENLKTPSSCYFLKDNDW